MKLVIESEDLNVVKTKIMVDGKPLPGIQFVDFVADIGDDVGKPYIRFSLVGVKTRAKKGKRQHRVVVDKYNNPVRYTISRRTNIGEGGRVLREIKKEVIRNNNL